MISLLLLSSSALAEKLIVLGDSLTEGYGVSKESAFPSLLEEQLHKNGKSSWVVVNAGISGSTTASAPSRMQWLLKQKPDLVLLALGANDGLRGNSIQAAKENLKKAIQLAQKGGAKVFLLGMEMPPNYGKKYTNEFRAMYADLAKEHKIPLMPFLLKDVATIAKLNQADGIHPNEEGHKIISKNLFEFLKGRL